MEVKIAPQTRAALETDTALRILIKTKFKLDSRHSQPVIARAESIAKALTRAMLKDIRRKADRVIIQMIMVHLLNKRSNALVCFDLFFEECNERARRMQPVHEVSKRGNVYHVRRSKELDAMVASEYMSMYNADKGPRPFFSDSMNPPLYDGGVRVEKRMDGSDPRGDLVDEDIPDEDIPHEDEPEEDGPKEGEPKEDEPKEDEPNEDEPVQDEPKENGLKGDGQKEGEPKQDEPQQDESQQDEPKQDKPKEDGLKGDGTKEEEQLEGNKWEEDGYAKNR